MSKTFQKSIWQLFQSTSKTWTDEDYEGPNAWILTTIERDDDLITTLNCPISVGYHLELRVANTFY